MIVNSTTAQEGVNDIVAPAIAPIWNSYSENKLYHCVLAIEYLFQGRDTSSKYGVGLPCEKFVHLHRTTHLPPPPLVVSFQTIDLKYRAPPKSLFSMGSPVLAKQVYRMEILATIFSDFNSLTAIRSFVSWIALGCVDIAIRKLSLLNFQTCVLSLISCICKPAFCKYYVDPWERCVGIGLNLRICACTGCVQMQRAGEPQWGAVTSSTDT